MNLFKKEIIQEWEETNMKELNEKIKLKELEL
jgi:hypothetical protein